MSDFDSIRSRVQRELFAGRPGQAGRLGWDAATIADWQLSRLRALLGYALERSPFHARRLAGVDPDGFRLADLATLPVMTKADMMSQWDDVVTDPRLTLAAAERALAATRPRPVPVLGEYLCLATGGSSGRRGVFASDAVAIAVFCGLLMRPAVARSTAQPGAGPGAPAGLVAAFVGAASAIHATRLCPEILAGSPVTFHPVPVTLPLAQVVAGLNELQAPFLFGYPSMLTRLAGEQRAGRLRISPLGVTATSETLLPAVAAAIGSAFGAPVVNTFATTEGLVGVSDPGETTVTIGSDGCIAELVDERYRPVPPGTPSARVLVTNLYNRVQPLIRYELTDSFTRQPDARQHGGHLRAMVEGRSDEVLRFKNADIHPLVLRSVLVASPAVSDYQVRQTPAGIAVAVQSDQPSDLGALRGRLRSALARAGLPDPDVRIDAVPLLPRDPETGKLRRFIPV